jgi:hypothetical protein
LIHRQGGSVVVFINAVVHVFELSSTRSKSNPGHQSQNSHYITQLHQK